MRGYLQRPSSPVSAGGTGELGRRDSATDGTSPIAGPRLAGAAVLAGALVGVVILAVAIGTFGGPIGALAQEDDPSGPGGTPIESCQVIDDPGHYYIVADNLTMGSSNCIEITSSSVGLDGNGKVIRSGSSTSGTAVVVTGDSGVVVEDLRVEEVGTAVSFQSVANGRIENVRSNAISGAGIGTYDTGIEVIGGASNEIRGNSLSEPGTVTNDHGILISSSPNNEVVDNDVTRPYGAGIKLNDAADNEVRGNEIHGTALGTRPSQYGILLEGSDSDDNAVVDNLIQGNSNIDFGHEAVVDGIVVRHGARNDVEDNALYDLYDDGIVVNANDTDVVGNSVNSVGASGIRVAAEADTANVSENFVDWASRRGEGAGIEVRGILVDLLGNTVVDGDETGIYVNASLPPTVEDNAARFNDGWEFQTEDTQSFQVRDLRMNDGARWVNANGHGFALGDGSRPDSPIPDGKQDVGVFVNTSAEGGAITGFTLGYSDGAVSSVDESTLDMWSHDTTWVETSQNNVVDPADNTVSGHASYDQATFAPLADNEDPVVLFSASPENASFGEAVEFDASGSFDPDGEIVEYRWDLDGDGTVDETTTDPETTHAYGAVGTFDAELTVVDEGGGTNATTVPVEVELVDTSGAGQVWRQSGYDLARTGHAPTNSGPVDAVTERWSTTIDGVNGDVVVSDGVLYTSNDSVHALHAVNGTGAWSPVASYVPGGSVGDLAVRDGLLVVGTSDTIAAVAAGTGNEIWNGVTDASGTNLSLGAQELLVRNGTVYAGTDDGLRAIDATTGTALDSWSYGDGDHIFSSPAYAGGRLYVGGLNESGSSDTGFLAAVDPTDGSELWRVEQGDARFRTPVVRNGSVYAADVGPNSSVLALDASTGAEQWNVSLDSDVEAAPAVTDERLFLPTFAGDGNGSVRALDVADGNQSWQHDLTYSLATPAVVNETVYVADTSQGNVLAIAAGDGAVRWNRSLVPSIGVNGVHTDPAVLDDTVYVGEEGGDFVALSDPAAVDPPNVSVEIDRTNSPVAKGGTLAVRATVENTGDRLADQTVALSVGGVERAVRNVSLPATASETVTLTWETAESDVGTDTATVASADDSATASVEVSDRTTGGGQIGSCADIGSPGVYELSGDVVGDDGSPCIEIHESDVVLDGQGHEIDMAGSGTAVELSAPNATNVTVRNLAVRDADYGIDVGVADFDAVSDLRLADSDVEADVDAVAVELSAADAASTVDGLRFDGNDLAAGANAFEFDFEGAAATVANVTLAENDVVVDADRTAHAVDVEARDDDQTVDLALADNEFNATGYGFELESGGIGTTLDLSVTNNTMTGPGSGEPIRDGVVIDAGENDKTVNVTARHNRIVADETAVAVETDSGDDVALNAAVTDNDVQADDGIDLEVGSDRLDGTVAVERNDLNVTGVGLALDGSEQAVDLSLVVADNVVWNEPSPGIEVEVSDDDVRTDATIRNNEIRSEDVGLDLGFYGDNVTVEADVTFNEIHAGFDALTVEGPVAGIDLAYNVFATDEHGVYSYNSSAAVDARNNYWNASDGPSSDGPYEDPVTGTLADGSGSEITERSGDVANVRFDPWLESPPQPSPNFDVSVDATDAPVDAGQTMTVEATVQNTGSERATQTVSLSTNGTERDATSVTLSPGESTTVSLTWATSGSDAGTHAATVASDDTSDRTDVTVQGSGTAHFAVSVDGTNVPVAAGQDVDVDVLVENTGTAAGTQSVDLSGTGLGGASTDVTLAADESTTVTLTLPTAAGDAGTYGGTVASADDSATVDFEVTALDAAHFAVSVDATNAPVTEGDDVDVEVLVENTGDVADTQSVELSGTGLGSASTDVTLDPGESSTVTLSLATAAGDAGNYSGTVASGNDSAPVTFDVDEADPSAFEVSVADTNAPVAEGETVEVTAEVENTGGDSATQTIDLDVFGLARQEEVVTLAGGESTTVTFSISTATGDAGFYRGSLASEDDSTAVAFDVVAPDPAQFSVADASAAGPVTAGDDLSVTATVENTGDLAGSGTVELANTDIGAPSTDVALEPGESTTVELTLATAAGDAGNYTARVRSPNGSLQVAFEVLEAPAPEFDVTSVDADSPVTAGDDVSVTAGVANTGDASGTTTVSLADTGLGVTETDVALDPGESTTVALSLGTDVGDGGTYSGEVRAGNASAPVAFEVVEPDPASFAVSIDETNAPVTAGENLSVTVAVENTGELAGTQALELSADGLGTVETDLSLDAGESTTATLTLPTAPGDAGSYSGTLGSENDSETVDVEVLAQSTPTPTATPTVTPPTPDTPTSSPVEDAPETTTSDDGPGFGAVVAVLALLSVGVLARRRD